MGINETGAKVQINNTTLMIKGSTVLRVPENITFDLCYVLIFRMRYFITQTAFVVPLTM